MTSWRFVIHLFLVVFSIIHLAKTGCYDYFKFGMLNVSFEDLLTKKNVQFYSASNLKDAIECTLEKDCQRSNNSCFILGDCFNRMDKVHEMSPMCKEYTIESMSLYHFLCLTARALNHSPEGCDFENTCSLYSRMTANQTTSTPTTIKATAAPTTIAATATPTTIAATAAPTTIAATATPTTIAATAAPITMAATATPTPTTIAATAAPTTMAATAAPTTMAATAAPTTIAATATPTMTAATATPTTIAATAAPATTRALSPKATSLPQSPTTTAAGGEKEYDKGDGSLSQPGETDSSRWKMLFVISMLFNIVFLLLAVHKRHSMRCRTTGRENEEPVDTNAEPVLAMRGSTSPSSVEEMSGLIEENSPPTIPEQKHTQ